LFPKKKREKDKEKEKGGNKINDFTIFEQECRFQPDRHQKLDCRQLL
jgi:hypothetical protein